MLPATFYSRRRGDTAAREAGLRYEAKAQEYLAATLGSSYVPAQILSFRDDTPERRLIIPDGIYGVPTHFILFEIKSQHVPDAWWQLRQLYQPVLRCLSHLEVFCVEVCGSFDPAMPFPEPIEWIEDLAEYVKRPSRKFGVFQWRP
jgi:hypothetical protein